MEQGILTGVIVPNLFGFCLTAIIMCSNFWRIKERSVESFCISAFFVLILCGSLLDSACYFFEGKPETFYRYGNFVSNTLLYIINMFNAAVWFLFLVNYIQFRLNIIHKAILAGFFILGIFVIILNCFVPVVFSLDSNNFYNREWGYFLYIFIDHGFVIDSLILYLIGRSRGGLLKFFPLWIYAIPLIVGTAIQTYFYGLSALYACYAISFAGLLSSLQNNMSFKDIQTGVYNKTYLDRVSKLFSKEKNKKITLILLNVNEFRLINENYGRDMGDKVLTVLAKLLSQSIGETGNVVHYSADEFIILLNSQTEMVCGTSIAGIKANIGDYNNKREFPFKISVRIKTSLIDLGKHSINTKLEEMIHTKAEED